MNGCYVVVKNLVSFRFLRLLLKELPPFFPKFHGENVAYVSLKYRKYKYDSDLCWKQIGKQLQNRILYSQQSA